MRRICLRGSPSGFVAQIDQPVHDHRADNQHDDDDVDIRDDAGQRVREIPGVS
jgi:hypothetical protein